MRSFRKKEKAWNQSFRRKERETAVQDALRLGKYLCERMSNAPPVQMEHCRTQRGSRFLAGHLQLAAKSDGMPLDSALSAKHPASQQLRQLLQRGRKIWLSQPATCVPVGMLLREALKDVSMTSSTSRAWEIHRTPGSKKRQFKKVLQTEAKWVLVAREKDATQDTFYVCANTFVAGIRSDGQVVSFLA